MKGNHRMLIPGKIWQELSVAAMWLMTVVQREWRGTHNFFLKLRVPPSELVVHITRQIFEPASGQSRQLLSGLVALRMKVVANRQERYCECRE